MFQIRMLEGICCINSQYIYLQFNFRKISKISQAKLISHSKFSFLFNKCKTFNPEVVCLDDEERHFWTLKLKERNPVDILSREEQDFTSQDANSNKRLSC